MYAFFALVVAALFASITLFLPFKLHLLTHLVPRRAHHALVSLADRVWICDESDAARQGLRLAKAWFFLAAIIFAIFGIRNGSMIRNELDSIAEVTAYGANSVLLSALVIFSVVAYAKLLPGLRTRATMRRGGIRGLWFANNDRLPLELTERLEQKAQESRFIGIVDVTGFGTFVKSLSPRDALVRDVIAACPEVPVSLLLLNPYTKEQDPDSRQLSVRQAVLKEMNLQFETWVSRLQQTLRAIQKLNRERPPEAQIQVRYYGERPAHRCVLFDDFLLLSPWNGRTPEERQPCLEISKSAEGAAFYETFRRMVARMWLHGERQNLDPGSTTAPRPTRSSVRLKLRHRPTA